MPDTSHEISLGDDTRRSLVRLLRVAYPHARSPTAPTSAPPTRSWASSTRTSGTG